MPVSKSKRKRKRPARPPARRAPEHESIYDFPGETAFNDIDDADEALAAELDTDAAIAELKRAGTTFRPETLAAAEELILEALQADRKEQLIDLAVRALKLCPWCADAYGLLAMGARDHPRLALHLQRLAMAAAEFALDADWGQDLRQVYRGDYWSHAATRAYMRAGCGLAETLADRGDWEAAADQLESLMPLNATDDQGLRYQLANCLLMLGRDQRLAELLAECGDLASAFAGFNRAVLAFRRDGDTASSRAALAKAMDANPHVLDYLLGERAMPPAEIRIFEPGSEDEATFYVECTAEGWRATPGALDWLRRAAGS